MIQIIIGIPIRAVMEFIGNTTFWIKPLLIASANNNRQAPISIEEGIITSCLLVLNNNLDK
jgi:hypothetical protein